MNVAITVWGDRISPVLDCARTVLVAEIDKGKILSRRRECFAAESLAQMIRVLSRQGVRVLICGAVSQEPADIVEVNGIELIPFLAGNVENILQTFARGRSIGAFVMPGCRCYRRCRMSRCGISRKREGALDE